MADPEFDPVTPGEILKYDQPVTPARSCGAYSTSYVERDVRTVLNVRDLGVFQRFVAMCAGNIGQLLNASRLGADLGVTHDTVRSWRSHAGHEIDVIAEKGELLLPVEAKAGSTVASDWFQPLKRWCDLAAAPRLDHVASSTTVMLQNRPQPCSQVAQVCPLGYHGLIPYSAPAKHGRQERA